MVPKGHEYMEQQRGVVYKVLDAGHIRIVDWMGDDNAVVQAARVSYGEGTKSVNEDRGLIRYLMSHWHSTPFEMAEIKLHVKLPIFVARQWIRHRTANVNEYSGRYSIVKDEFFIPSYDSLGVQSSTNSQGREYEEYSPANASYLQNEIRKACNNSFDVYADLLEPAQPSSGEKRLGLSRELARTVLPLNTYTEWYWKIDVHNLLHFIQLRNDPHAQYEIQLYAGIIADILRHWMPYTYEAFMDYRVNAITFSAKELEAIQSIVTMPGPHKGLTKRELQDFVEKIRTIHAHKMGNTPEE